jgi:putative transposase
VCKPPIETSHLSPMEMSLRHAVVGPFEVTCDGAVDRDGDTVEFLLTARRDEAAARRFLEQAIDQHGRHKTITIDKSGANTAAITRYNADHESTINLRQCKYLNNIVEQDHRAIKRMTRPMLGFKSWHGARILLAGIETMHMIRKRQLGRHRTVMSPAEQFYSLAY